MADHATRAARSAAEELTFNDTVPHNRTPPDRCRRHFRPAFKPLSTCLPSGGPCCTGLWGPGRKVWALGSTRCGFGCKQGSLCVLLNASDADAGKDQPVNESTLRPQQERNRPRVSVTGTADLVSASGHCHHPVPSVRGTPALPPGPPGAPAGSTAGVPRARADLPATLH